MRSILSTKPTFLKYAAVRRNIHEGAVRDKYIHRLNTHTYAPHVRSCLCLISAHAPSRDRALVWDVWNFSPVISTAFQHTANGKTLCFFIVHKSTLYYYLLVVNKLWDYWIILFECLRTQRALLRVSSRVSSWTNVNHITGVHSALLSLNKPRLAVSSVSIILVNRGRFIVKRFLLWQFWMTSISSQHANSFST